ncbi:MAG TPA: tRNA (adenosine(37)-N6)-threonylcarbamoyltransferase complex ATPase subunit type 1 TsaE [Ignavibacteriales bacterium]|nr:tRNA (adenosine(37)-N6)-threonylcarbamoyltransferase complex ATPase subunit type 1 TsaE [Ignavibacteriales bacterium]HOL81447.1 tRNA (adenosine(37)-N6)-threonylcarbamoyltransferase complex ATPase subunit type 1 TsaE [Ignavibacteriales bacterium]HOM65345.1 tRNA (adenosine(37)-N6)-threonylcarbamoyltransferase complex ATPase subunit type 1 TsaE [Ignavibacteriales bacterium]HPD66973.1 tRNA (adenosine(37)-N6)-threonylcarbamoyltransferase complex ATPase subunit type 1 TsaE [Ignavibacteriales bacter
MQIKNFNNIQLDNITSVASFILEQIEIKLSKYNNIIIKLNGNLGSGKTTLVKEILALNSNDNITSPSFSLVNEYSGKFKIIHIDFYRINNIEELYDIGLTDYFLEENTIVFIEWSELYPDLIPENSWEITIEYNNNLRNYKFVYE